MVNHAQSPLRSNWAYLFTAWHHCLHKGFGMVHRGSVRGEASPTATWYWISTHRVPTTCLLIEPTIQLMESSWTGFAWLSPYIFHQILWDGWNLVTSMILWKHWSTAFSIVMLLLIITSAECRIFCSSAIEGCCFFLTQYHMICWSLPQNQPMPILT